MAASNGKMKSRNVIVFSISVFVTVLVSLVMLSLCTEGISPIQKDAQSETITASSQGGLDDQSAAEGESFAAAAADSDLNDEDEDANSGTAVVPFAGDTANAGTSSNVAIIDDTVRSKDNHQKRWVEDTESVWIVDSNAWSEDVPIYGSIEVSICNICGADITGNTSAHGKVHMLAGEGSGHHSEIRQTITGYSTIYHPEQGHWETRVVGGHWE